MSEPRYPGKPVALGVHRPERGPVQMLVWMTDVDGPDEYQVDWDLNVLGPDERVPLYGGLAVSWDTIHRLLRRDVRIPPVLVDDLAAHYRTLPARDPDVAQRLDDLETPWAPIAVGIGGPEPGLAQLLRWQQRREDPRDHELTLTWVRYGQAAVEILHGSGDLTPGSPLSFDQAKSLAHEVGVWPAVWDAFAADYARLPDRDPVRAAGIPGARPLAPGRYQVTADRPSTERLAFCATVGAVTDQILHQVQDRTPEHPPLVSHISYAFAGNPRAPFGCGLRFDAASEAAARTFAERMAAAWTEVGATRAWRLDDRQERRVLIDHSVPAPGLAR